MVCHTCYKATFVNLKDALQLIDRLVLSVPTLTPGTAVRGSGGKSIRKQVVAVAKAVVATPVDTLLPTLVLPAFLKPGGWSMLHVHTGSGVFLDSSTNISGKCTIIQCDALTGTIVVNDCVQHRHVVKQSVILRPSTLEDISLSSMSLKRGETLEQQSAVALANAAAASAAAARSAAEAQTAQSLADSALAESARQKERVVQSTERQTPSPACSCSLRRSGKKQ